MLGELFPADPMSLGMLLEPLGLACGTLVPTRQWRELYSALDGAAVAAIHPFYTASVREFQKAGRHVIGSAPVGTDGTASWLEAIGEACGIANKNVAAAKNQFLPMIKDTLASAPINARLIISGYEGSELLVARLAVESGARVHYVGTACPATPWSANDAQWLESKGVLIKYRASLEDDLAALNEFKPDLAIGTTPLVQEAKSRAIPALYFTNLISSRPLMGVAGAGSIAQVINAALNNRDRFAQMTAFFEGVGEGDNAGIWESKPIPRPEFSAQYAKKLAKQANQRKSTATQ